MSLLMRWLRTSSACSGSAGEAPAYRNQAQILAQMRIAPRPCVCLMRLQTAHDSESSCDVPPVRDAPDRWAKCAFVARAPSAADVRALAENDKHPTVGNAPLCPTIR